ncbi:hypothetical protein ANN_01249 [Periplaneta americana]|uniref:Uncharacterized protein n=1 Tax=Periplaneta americana TaxID=6978 RepID=A0ABQ8TU47_PERAM|nr:hypothetical protein ANN_01249 [Periplaneta americana]
MMEEADPPDTGFTSTCLCRDKASKVNPWRYSPEGARPTSRLLASRPHAEAEVDDHPNSMEFSEVANENDLETGASQKSKQARLVCRSSTRVCVRICVSIRRPEFECSGPQLEGPEFECSGPQLEGPEFEYSELSLKDFLINVLHILLEYVPCQQRLQMWFMHDGWHTSIFFRNESEHLTLTFQDLWIDWGGPTPWPARSSNLNPLDFWFSRITRSCMPLPLGEVMILWIHTLDIDTFVGLPYLGSAERNDLHTGQNIDMEHPSMRVAIFEPMHFGQHHLKGTRLELEFAKWKFCTLLLT